MTASNGITDYGSRHWFESRFHRVEHERINETSVVIDDRFPPSSNAPGDVLIQVQQRGCCGVCSGRRYPQRKSSIFVVVLLDSGSRAVSIRGHGRRCESNRFEKVRTIELLSSYHPPLNPFRSLHSYREIKLLLLHILFLSCFSIFIYIYVLCCCWLLLLLLLLLLLRYRCSVATFHYCQQSNRLASGHLFRLHSE